jgi:hypothetical protein
VIWESRARKKSAKVALETDDPEIAKRHMRLLVAMLVARGRLSPDGGAAEVYGRKGAGRSQLKKVNTELRRLKALPEAKYGSEALAIAKRWGRPVGIIHHLTGRKPELSANAYRNRRTRARLRGRAMPMGDTWEHRRQGRKYFFWNRKVLNARLHIDNRRWQWPLKVLDEDKAEALMAPVRAARERLHEAAAEALNCELGTDAAVAAAAARAIARGQLAREIITAGGPKELAEVVIKGPKGEANRTDGAVSLPTLLAHLIQATHGPAVQLRFPADEGIRHAGWDGRTSTEIGSPYVPEGDAGWEISAQRNNIAQKASDDFKKRTAKPAPLDPANATYVSVTPRHWPQKDEWAKARQDEGPWRKVLVYDTDDLVHWIEQTPAVGLWLAARLGKRPPGTRELEEVWEEWSLATQWPLTEDLVLSDRDQDAAEVLRWLRGEPSVLSLQATTTEEVIAFFHATLSELPGDLADAYRAHCLVATTAAAARALANAPAPLILLLTEPEPGLARSLAERGHYVVQAYDERPVSRGEVRTLARPSREGIASALTAAGIAEPRAKALARDSARNLAVLRRLIPGAPGRLPKWARSRRPTLCWRRSWPGAGMKTPKPIGLGSRSSPISLTTR